MRIRLVTSLREFDALAPVWRHVTEQSGQTSPLISHDWFACSWRAAGPEYRRELIVIEDVAGPMAFIPLAHSRGWIGGFPVRRLGLLAPLDAPFVDVPIAGSVDAVLTTLFAELRQRGDWDVMSFVRLPSGSMTYKGLQGVLPGQFGWRIVRRDPSPYLTIAGGWGDFVQRLSAPMRSQCLSVEDQLERRGDVSIEEHRKVDTDGRAFIDAMEVFWSAWTGSHSDGFGFAQSLPRFFRELTRRASANGWLRLWLLRINGRAVATEYQLGNNGTLHALRRDHDASVRDVSLREGLTVGVVRALFKQGNTFEYDLGPTWTNLGWATGSHERYALNIYAPTAYGRLLHRFETRLLPVARRWRRRVGAS